MTSPLNVLRVFVDVTAIVVLITPAIKYVIGMTKRQSELSDIDERIKRSQREALDRSEATRQQENEEADRTIRVLAAKVDEIAARAREGRHNAERLCPDRGRGRLAIREF